MHHISMSSSTASLLVLVSGLNVVAEFCHCDVESDHPSLTAFVHRVSFEMAFSTTYKYEQGKR